MTTAPTTDIGLTGIDHVEFWVGNARTFAGFLASHLGFEVSGYLGPETGVRDRVSYVLEQNDLRYVVTGSLVPDSEISEHVKLHGDGVKYVAFTCSDSESAFKTVVGRGAEPVEEPHLVEDDSGKVVLSSIRTYGETVHRFIERHAYSGVFLPGYSEPRHTYGNTGFGLITIDHVVGNVELGQLERWVGFYREVMGFGQLVHFDDDDISTEYSALMSTVLEGSNGRILLPINEPADGKRKSQIEEYLDYYKSAGVQHIAMRTDDIVSAVRQMREQGVRFLRVPATYYEDVRTRLADLNLDWDMLEELGILIDRDHEGYLLQIFTETVTDRPCVFFEIIQREGSRGFGQGNFKALFVAIEQEQDQRGNL